MHRSIVVCALLTTACNLAVGPVTAPTTAPPPAPTTTSTTISLPVTTRPAIPTGVVGRPHGSVPGLVQFRGNPSHTWYGLGPVPFDPEIAWSFPDSPMCSVSTVADETRQWCGTGWTGQPVVWERPDGVTEVIFGAYDRAVHFLDAATGARTRPDFVTGDLIKGSVSLDPDGFPLLYFGSRDNKLRIVALDRPEPTELYAIDASDHPGVWNNDWDGNPSIVNDILYEGGENGILFAVQLNRSFIDGEVSVTPEILVKVEGWTDELFRSVGDRNASIESSVAIQGDRLYFTNSGGRVVGLDISAIRSGVAPIVFDFWAGDDIDASPVIDPDGSVYVAVELERFLPRASEVGQLLKLDPTRPDDPIVWSVDVPPREPGDGGLWATPALGDGVLYAATHPGELLAVDTKTGEVVWRDEIGFHAWSSPVLVDTTLVVAVDCDNGGALRAYDVSNPRLPDELWHRPLGTGCIESTPAVWNGGIYVGSRDGFFYRFGR